MVRQLIIVGASLFAFLLFGAMFSPALLAQSPPRGAVITQAMTPQTFPPLPPGCGAAGTPIQDYTHPVCCVSGYVYSNGAPVAGAEVTLAARGQTYTVQTRNTDTDAPPYFIARLDTDPLTLRPGDRVTMTATYQGQSHQLSFVAQAGGQQVDLIMPKINATWAAAPINTSDPAQIPPFTQWQAVGASYEQTGNYLLFGGIQGSPLSGTPQADTFRWQQAHWERITPATIPPARYGHVLVRNQSGDQLLMFGGVGAAGFYLADSWLWQNNDWQKVPTNRQPPARAYTSLTYDSQRNRWVLFGGVGDQGVYSDTWEFDGQNWHEQTPMTQPSPRQLASLTYDPRRQRAVLFGGRTVTTYTNDLWEWDGSAWTLVTPRHNPPAPRAGHGAAFDPEQREVVIAGGSDSYGGLQDTWAWDGSRWLARVANPSLPAMYGLVMDYDPVHQQMIAFGERAGGNQAGDGIWQHQVISTSYRDDARPIATIQSSNQRDGRQGLDTFIWLGRGTDGDATDHIVHYRWSHAALTVSTESTLTLPASALPLGTQEIAFTVQDDEGNWSTPVTQTLFVRTGDTAATGAPQAEWTLLLYIGADNNLAPRLGDHWLTNGLLYRLRSAGPQAHVQVGVLYDGPGANDTERYRLAADGQWLLDQPSLPEADMGQMETLRDFVRWGQAAFQSDYLALALVGPANGVVGFGQDKHGAVADSVSFLTPIELRSALQAATATRGRKLDLLFFDGSSFGLLEDAAIVDDVANFMLVSPGTSLGIYPYEQYRRLTTTANNPRAFARAVAQQYAESATVYGLPFSISVFDLNRFQPLQTTVGQLGASLVTYIGQDRGRQDAVEQIRNTLYAYDSNGKAQSQAKTEDLYIDLREMVNTMAISVTDISVQAAAHRVGQQVPDFVIYHKNALAEQQTANGTLYGELARLGGVGLFYPPNTTAPPGSANEAYLQNRLFYLTVDWGWTAFLTHGPPTLPFCPPDCPPFLADNLVLEPLPARTTQLLYLPLIVTQ